MDTENYMNEKSAFIAIVGRPNVGKSSILNRLLGTKLAIVSNKPQTTRTRIMGVWTEGETQLVFIDTPGLIKPKNSLGDYMVKSVTSSVADVDACLLVVEANTKISKADEELVHRFKDLGVPALLAINKIDLLQDKSVLMEQIAKLSALYDFEAVVPVSAQDGNGMDALREELIALAEPGGHFFSEDTLTDQPERAIVAEIIREKALHALDDEIPHGIAVCIDRMKQRKGQNIMDIEATIVCERDSHKGIVIGKGGAMLKKIGSNARYEIERLLEEQVNLKLWVKVKKDWRDSDSMMKNFGYNKDEI